MPHKKNPDVFELLRARCNRLKALPAQIQTITANLPSGYHRDFQIIKEQFLTAFSEMEQCLAILNHVLPMMQVKKDILQDERYRNLFSVEAVNELVKQGLPFREAYHQVARQIKEGALSEPKSLKHTHIGSIGNLSNEKIKQQMEKVIERFCFERWHKAIAKLLEWEEGNF